jgi:hypothetical protein
LARRNRQKFIGEMMNKMPKRWLMKLNAYNKKQNPTATDDAIETDNNIAVYDLTFYRADDDGNELKDDQGKVITYRAETDCTYLAEGLDVDDLEEVENA